MLTFSQAVNETVRTVCDQMRRTGATSPSSSLLRRHASKHIGSPEPRLVGPVVEAARDEIARDRVNVALIERRQRLSY